VADNQPFQETDGQPTRPPEKPGPFDRPKGVTPQLDLGVSSRSDQDPSALEQHHNQAKQEEKNAGPRESDSKPELYRNHNDQNDKDEKWQPLRRSPREAVAYTLGGLDDFDLRREREAKRHGAPPEEGRNLRTDITQQSF
jgi:hypothetical protein